MIASNPQYAPEFQLDILGKEVPTPLRASITSVRLQSGMEGADRVEISLFNERLRWLDDPLLKKHNELRLWLGYQPGPLEVVFGGEIIGTQASFPSSGTPTLQISAQDGINRLQKGKNSRWFSKEVSHTTNMPIPRRDLAARVASASGLKTRFDPLGGDLAALVGEVAGVLAESLGTLDPGVPQKAVDRQVKSRDYELLKKIAREGGYDLMVGHEGKDAGSALVFFAPWAHLDPAIVLNYGRSLLEFNPKDTDAGQVDSVRANVWEPANRAPVAVTLSWDPGRMALAVKVDRGKSEPAGDDSELVIDEPLTLGTAPRRLVSELVPRLNSRSTGSGSAVGDPRIRPGVVLEIGGVGERFGGLYRVTSATHTIDSGGYRTQFDARQEIWFKLPKASQGAVRVTLPPALGRRPKR